MPIIFNCPACGRELEAPDEALGSTGACRFCGAEIVSPTVPEGPATLLASGPVGMQSTPGDVSKPTGQIYPGEILSEAWALIKVHWAIILAANLIVGVIYLGALAPWFIPVIREAMQHPGSLGTQQQLPHLTSVGIIAVNILLAPLLAGPLYLIDRILVRGDASIGAVFAGFQRYKAFLQFEFLFNLPSFALLMVGRSAVASTPVERLLLNIAVEWPVILFVLVAFRPGQMEIVDRGANGITALKASWEFTKGHRWMILGTWLLLLIAYMAGLLACCLGVFFTMGFIPLGEVLIYRHLRGLQGTPD